MTHASLFSGIGGFDLAAHWAGIENVFACEIDEFCRKVLAKRFPNTTLYKDIKETKFGQYCGTVDIISGGFPCQPFSVAGKRAGTTDNRYLWGEMLRVVREVQPEWVIAENVRGLTNIANGSTFETVCNDLEVSGYKVQSFIIPALTVGAPHKRDRIWIIAHSDSNVTKHNTGEIQEPAKDNEGKTRQEDRERMWGKSGAEVNQSPLSATNSEGLRYGGRGDGNNSNDRERFIYKDKQNNRNPIRGKADTGNELVSSDPTGTGSQRSNKREIQLNDNPGYCGRQSWAEKWIEAIARIYGMDDGLSGGMDGLNERYKDRSRRQRIKTMGNSIVPQIAYQIFIAIKEANR